MRSASFPILDALEGGGARTSLAFILILAHTAWVDCRAGQSRSHRLFDLNMKPNMTGACIPAGKIKTA
ncbi:hypothetical protein DAH51_25525 [Sphingobium yanoikuyae]|uniref:Uncharacterized protein n=1 Tax=Sphingobium yanoikuyae TaxID=13690 RepID=A0A430BD77_SPHYA|nr:hypothetical protein DAH51_25525 [Sphingobium yanoikuyae]